MAINDATAQSKAALIPPNGRPLKVSSKAVGRTIGQSQLTSNALAVAESKTNERKCNIRDDKKRIEGSRTGKGGKGVDGGKGRRGGRGIIGGNGRKGGSAGKGAKGRGARLTPRSAKEEGVVRTSKQTDHHAKQPPHLKSRATCPSKAHKQKVSAGEGGSGSPPADAPVVVYNRGVASREVYGDSETALELFRRAAARGHPKAAYNCAVLSAAAKDETKALEFFRLAASRGVVEAHFALGLLLLGRQEGRAAGQGSGGEGAASREEALRHLRCAADRGHAKAHWEVARALESWGPDAVCADPRAPSGGEAEGEAMFRLRAAAQQGCLPAMLRLGDKLLRLERREESSGCGRPRPPGSPAEEKEAAAEANEGVDSKADAAARATAEAATIAGAQANSGRHTGYGSDGTLPPGTPPSSLEEQPTTPPLSMPLHPPPCTAVGWYRLAAGPPHDSAAAMFNLAMCLSSGSHGGGGGVCDCGGRGRGGGGGGTMAVAEEALSMLEKAARAGHPKACYNLARRKLHGGGLRTFAHGGGVARDVAGAVALLRAAAAHDRDHDDHHGDGDGDERERKEPGRGGPGRRKWAGDGRAARALRLVLRKQRGGHLLSTAARAEKAQEAPAESEAEPKAAQEAAAAAKAAKEEAEARCREEAFAEGRRRAAAAAEAVARAARAAGAVSDDDDDEDDDGGGGGSLDGPKGQGPS